MKRSFTLFCSLLPCFWACAQSADPHAMQRVPGDAPHLERQVRKLSVQLAPQGRQVVVYFHAGWCEPCRMLDAAFSRAPVQRALARYDLVEVNVDEMPSSKALGLSIDFIPFLARLDARGKVAATLEGEAFGPDPSETQVDRVLVKFLGS